MKIDPRAWILGVGAVVCTLFPIHANPPREPEPGGDWSLHRCQRPPLPAVSRSGWVRNGIDAFIAAKLEAKGLAPAAAADKLTLLKRVTYDLTGLSPTPEER